MMESVSLERPEFNHRQVDMAACAVVLSIGAAAFWFGLRPVFQAEDQQRLVGERLTQSREQLQAAQLEYEQVRQTIATTRRRLEQSTVVLHTADGLVTRQEAVSRTVVEGGLRLEQLIVGSAVPGELLDTIPLHITGEGEFPRVVAIMHELRAQFPDMAITSFQISGGGSGLPSENEAKVRFVLDVAWYTARSGGSRA